MNPALARTARLLAVAALVTAAVLTGHLPELLVGAALAVLWWAR